MKQIVSLSRNDAEIVRQPPMPKSLEQDLCAIQTIIMIKRILVLIHPFAFGEMIVLVNDKQIQVFYPFQHRALATEL